MTLPTAINTSFINIPFPSPVCNVHNRQDESKLQLSRQTLENMPINSFPNNELIGKQNPPTNIAKIWNG
jgi:hypothetical protein